MAKGDNHSLMGPNMRLGNIVKSTAMIPGAPGGMGGDSNNPYPVQQASSAPVNPTSLYGDLSLNNLTQVGTGILNPENIPRSPLQQNQPPGRGKNAGAQYGLQPQQISGNIPDAMESSRLATLPMGKQMPIGPMGMAGQQAIPGGLPGNMPGTTGGPMMANLNMTPGADPVKTGQRKKSKKGKA
tara:strand:- start:301 stop:852 length:552 start_codon:yes stop_codon:yes gene_type:complete